MPNCELCGKPFTPDQFHKNQRFCSRQCQNKAYAHQHYETHPEYYTEYYRKNYQPLNNSTYTPRGPYGSTCLQCGKTLVRRKKYCSRECKRKAEYEKFKTDPIAQQHKTEYDKRWREARQTALYPDVQLDYELEYNTPIKKDTWFIPIIIDKVWKRNRDKMGSSWRNIYTIIPENETEQYLKEHPNARLHLIKRYRLRA